MIPATKAMKVRAYSTIDCPDAFLKFFFKNICKPLNKKPAYQRRKLLINPVNALAPDQEEGSEIEKKLDEQRT